MIYILSFLFCAAESFSGVLLCDAFARRRHSNYLSILYILGEICLSVFLFNSGFFPISTWAKAILSLLMWTILLRLLFACSVWQSVFFSGSVYILTNILDYCTLLVAALTMGKSMLELRTGFASFVFLGVIAKLLLFSLAYITNRIMRAKQKKLHLSAGYWLCLFLIPLFTIVSLNFATQYNLTRIKPDPYVLWNVLSLLAIHLILVYQLEKVSMERWERAQLQVLQKEIALRMENATQLMEAYEVQRKESHDFTNHLAVIRELVAEDQKDDAQKYIDRILGSKKQYFIVDTGDPVINAVLNEKYSKAKSKDVYIRFKINKLTAVRMDRKDLVTILGNLLDNAIEASQKVSGERLIVFKFLTSSTGKAILSVRNTSNPVAIEDGMIRSTKESTLLHGYGLSNIKHVLDQYGYPHTYSWNDGWFTFVAELACDLEDGQSECACPKMQ